VPPPGYLKLIIFGCALVLLTVVGLRVMAADAASTRGGSERGVARVMISIPVEIIEDGEAPALRRVEVAR